MERADLGRLFALSSPSAIEPASGLAAPRINRGRKKAAEMWAAEQRRADKFGLFLDSLGEKR